MSFVLRVLSVLASLSLVCWAVIVVWHVGADISVFAEPTGGLYRAIVIYSIGFTVTVLVVGALVGLRRLFD